MSGPVVIDEAWEVGSAVGLSVGFCAAGVPVGLPVADEAPDLSQVTPMTARITTITLLASQSHGVRRLLPAADASSGNIRVFFASFANIGTLTDAACSKSARNAAAL